MTSAPRTKTGPPPPKEDDPPTDNEYVESTNSSPAPTAQAGNP